jgi:hypothetical protein
MVASWSISEEKYPIKELNCDDIGFCNLESLQITFLVEQSEPLYLPVTFIRLNAVEKS